ncbi:MAG TPA: adenylyl-sulfate kinase [Myxococcaceae bacterium]|nr:adenylyl-sulfate kinase [Myxococcaceae bacterium]
MSIVTGLVIVYKARRMASNSNGFTVWLTGMSGAGKTALANYVAARLRQVGKAVEILDENDVSGALWDGLGETKEERATVMRRLGFVANLLARNSAAVLVAAVSPYKSVREENRKLIGRYVEVYVDCPTEKLIQRDSTGRYKKALAGELPNFIGITEPYEPPGSAEVVIRSDSESVEEGGLKIFQALLDFAYVSTDDLKVITGKRMKAGPPKKARISKDIRAARPAARSARVAKKAAAKRKR